MVARASKQRCSRPGGPAWRSLVVLAASLVLLAQAAVWASGFGPGPLIRVSGPDPLAACIDDLQQPGHIFVDTAIEPFLAVDPRNPANLAAAWQQDRWSNGGSRGIIAGVSRDRGTTWESNVIPKLTPCTGEAAFGRVTDPWLSFSRAGALFHAAVSYNVNSPDDAILVSRSVDDGSTWGDPIAVYRESNPRASIDKSSITADPTDARFVYATFMRVEQVSGRRPSDEVFSGQTMFARSTNGGDTWEPGHVLFNHGPNAVGNGQQVLVRPDGSLVLVLGFTTGLNQTGAPSHRLATFRSVDKGKNWLPGYGPLAGPAILPGRIVDPDTGAPVRTPGDPPPLFDAAVNRRDGELYAVWQDRRFNTGQFASIAFTRSTNGGQTWSAPVKINQTPTGIPPQDQQAMIPAIQVGADGALAVTYYDFRFNTPAPGAATDYWAVHCPAGADPTRPANWGDEVRLTNGSFNLEQAPVVTLGYFLGDYMGRASGPDGFTALFIQPTGPSRTAAFFRRWRRDPG